MTDGGHFHTTIKVSSEMRDRLKEQARKEHRTLGEQLAYLLELGDRQAMFESMSAAIDATPPELMQSYEEESAYWERLSGA